MLAGTERPREQIIERIRKSLALSQSPNENEAALALETAHRLLAKYNLSMDEIADVGTEELIVEGDRFEIGNRLWKMNLWCEIASANYCEPIITPGRTKWLRFVGRKDNIAAVMAMGNWVVTELEHMVQMAVITRREQTINNTVYRNSYLLGAVKVISMRLQAMAQQDDTESTALTVRLAAENEDYLNARYGKMKTRDDGAQRVNIVAFQTGAVAGRAMNLSPTRLVTN